MYDLPHSAADTMLHQRGGMSAAMSRNHGQGEDGHSRGGMYAQPGSRDFERQRAFGCGTVAVGAFRYSLQLVLVQRPDTENS